MPGQVVDTQTAEEFMGEVLARVSGDDLVGIADACAAKSAGFAALLADGRAATLGRGDLRRVLRSIFATRRKADAIIDGVGADRLAAEVHELLHGPAPVPARIERFDAALAGFEDPAFDLPGELLHFTYPDRYWLWTRWMWDPRIETGSLRLVTMEELDLAGFGRGDTYVRIGEAVTFVHETGRAAGFTAHGEPTFAIDVFLASVYAIYMYTVLRMRMTQEFNKIVPDLPDLVRRLLGVYRPEV
ncbi:MAG TPA: hypothetical protein VFI47_21815 [Acidimicrobiales bacterium]|nr:hypothetical protein [Acidimicrobiales bacterium]